MHSRALVLLAAAVPLFAASCSNSTSRKAAAGLQGAGATFPAPLYRKWFEDYFAEHPEGTRVHYEAIGSGAGVELFSEGKVDFGASDAAMSDEQIAAVPEGVQLLPMTGGAVALAYNLPDVPDVKLSRDAYVGVFQGAITSWDDPKIAEANKNIKLPSTKIQVVHRLGASGTTFVFTQHLSAVSDVWSKGPGKGLTIPWPVGAAARGSDGVAEAIEKTPGAIGYMDLGLAQRKNLETASLQNKAGEYVKPSVQSAEAALAAMSLPENLRGWLPDPEGKGCYPIVTLSWLLVRKKYPNAPLAGKLKDVLTYGLTSGQKECAALGYIPLPEKIREASLSALKGLHFGD